MSPLAHPASRHTVLAGTFAAVVMTLAVPGASRAQSWTAPVRGSWVQADDRGAGVVIAAPGSTSEIIVAGNENSAVRQAAVFLAGDIGRITGRIPAIVSAAGGARTKIHLVTLGGAMVPSAIASDALRGRAESHHILAAGDDIWLVGADARGTAFAAYTLSERIGIDPLYRWTGFTPERRTTLILRPTNHLVGPPTIRYRGLFHDDEDILPRPFEDAGYPLRIGDVPLEWYARFFETALRLRMNMVAPYARAHRRAEVQQMASDWGLFYTSHHYDILLSNPFGFERYGLARERGAGNSWDWYTNRRGMLDYWRGGVRESAALHAIWPVGLRGAEDRAYDFPANTSPAEQARVFREAVDSQIAIARVLTPTNPSPPFTFTLYSEMLEKVTSGALSVPPEVILVWPDDNDGVMRGLPTTLDGRKHGVYYHLAYFGPRTKQVTHIVSPATVAREFTRIRDAGATEYALVNVSELRDFIMETRMIADVAWNATTTLSPPDPSSRFVTWWSHEYFGDAGAAADASYADRQRLLARFDDIWRGAEQVRASLRELRVRFNGAPSHPLAADAVATLSGREREYGAAVSRAMTASLAMTAEARQFFFEHVVLGMLIDWRPTQAALLLDRAVREPDARRAWTLVEQARAPLETLESEILRAERPPFEGWYRKTWIRRENSPSNVHRSHEQLRVFIASRGADTLAEPPGAAHPDLRRFCEGDNLCSGYRAEYLLSGGYVGRFNDAAAVASATGAPCDGRLAEPSRVSVHPIADDMHYLDAETRRAVRYPGVTTLARSWINVRGGGASRATLRDGEAFYRCSDVPAIQLGAVSADGIRRTGWVRAVYGAVPSPGGAWSYGWTVHSHQHDIEAVVRHLDPAPAR